MCRWGRVAVLFPDIDAPPGEKGATSDGVARYAPLVDDCEREHDHVLMVCGQAGASGPWEDFCLGRADRVVVVASGPVGERVARRLAGVSDTDLLGLGVDPVAAAPNARDV